jgi:hypothetical protein
MQMGISCALKKEEQKQQKTNQAKLEGENAKMLLSDNHVMQYNAIQCNVRMLHAVCHANAASASLFFTERKVSS